MENKKPFALLLNDIHVGKDNIPEFQKNWEEAIQICKSKKIHTIIVGGDLFMSRSAQTLPIMLAVCCALDRARYEDIFVVLAEGNHDLCDQESLYGYCHIFNQYQQVDVVETFRHFQMSDDADLFVMSYFPENGSFMERYDVIKGYLDEKKFNVLYIHQGIKGGLAQPREDELPANIFDCFDSVLVGHYHDRKQIPGTNIMYIGASRQHNFGEDEEKGYTVLYDDGSSEFIKNKANIRYLNVDIDTAHIDAELKQMLKKTKESEQYKVKVRVHCKSNEVNTIDRQELIDCGATRIELATEDIEAANDAKKQQSLSTKFDKYGIKEEYKTFCVEKNVEDVEIGLQYLDKIN